MAKKREMRGQPGKKVGCPDRQWMLEGSFINVCNIHPLCAEHQYMLLIMHSLISTGNVVSCFKVM